MQSLIQNHMRYVRSESAREQRIELYKTYDNNNNNNTEHARIFKDTPFFNVFVLFLLVWYIFLERHGYHCCLLISVNKKFKRERKRKTDRRTDRQTENSYSNTKTFCSKDCIPC